MMKIFDLLRKDTDTASLSHSRDFFSSGHAAKLFVVILLFSVLCYPVFAHSAAQMGVAPDQYDRGIPVYWPVHASLMILGLAFLVTGMVIMRYHKTSNWYKMHTTLQKVGGTSVIAGLSIAIVMVSLSDISHFVSSHGILGIFTIGLIFSTIIVGSLVIRYPEKKDVVAPGHRWMGRIAIGLVIINIILGISMMGAVLAQ